MRQTIWPENSSARHWGSRHLPDRLENVCPNSDIGKDHPCNPHGANRLPRIQWRDWRDFIFARLMSAERHNFQRVPLADPSHSSGEKTVGVVPVR